jgi:hypothetical protein
MGVRHAELFVASSFSLLVRVHRSLSIATFAIAAVACATNEPTVTPIVPHAYSKSPWFCAQWHDPEVTMCQQTFEACASANETHGEPTTCVARRNAWCFRRTDKTPPRYQYCAARSIDCDRIRGAVANVIPTSDCARVD